MSEPATRFTLRQLPLPAKLVITLFLLTVGLGYSSAMVQLHMQHSERDGTTLPTVKNVVAVFAGKVWRTPDDAGPQAPSRLEAIVSGPKKGGLTGTNMTPAFFDKDDADYSTIAKKNPEKLPQLDAERDGERRVVVAWINSAPETRKKAHDDDAFTLPKELAKQPLTKDYRKDPNTVQIRTLLMARCARCHKEGGEKGDVPLRTYEQIVKFLPVTVEVPPGGGYVDSGRQMSLEKLTQSTHAHLLSFAVLFTLTGLTFAFTSYPGVVRGILGPVVLLAQAADVSCWWLARLPDVGPYFATAIVGTGGVVGLGLSAQIVLSLFNMYGPKGKVVLVGLFALAAGAGGLAYKNVIDPYLQDEKAKATAVKAEAIKPAPKDQEPKPNESKKGPIVPPVVAGPSILERQLTGSWEGGQWPMNGKAPDGAMARAFYDKESEFKDALKNKAKDPETFKALLADREGEQAVTLAWVKSAPDARKKAFEEDKFPLPADLAKRPITADMRWDDKAVKIKTLLDVRCFSCHSGEVKVPLDTYEGLEKYLKPATK